MSEPIHIIRLKELMEDTSSSIKTVAEVLDCDRNTVSFYLSNKNPLKVDQLYKLSQMFNVQPCAFFMEEREYINLMSAMKRLNDKDEIISEKDKLIEQMSGVINKLDSMIQNLLTLYGKYQG